MEKILSGCLRMQSRVLLIVALLAGFGAAQASGPIPAQPLPEQPRGKVINSVACLGNPDQSYALYLPSNYSPDRRWPIIYAFDPFARGKVPVDLFKEAAEKYGYIVAGSNNAKNGPGSLEMAAAEAIWQDTHRRFMIDKDRVYTTGLSGGARFATSFALYCYTCSIAGVIAQGATYPVKEYARPANTHFLYYVTIGNQDFNYPEVAALREKREEHDTGFEVNIFPGPHQWAPPNVVEDAVAWLELKAMQDGKEKPRPAFIQQQLAKKQAEAVQAEKSGDVMAQYEALRVLALDFKGLADVSRSANQLAELRKSKAFKHARQEEKHEADQQQSLTANTSADIAGLGRAGPEQIPMVQHRILSVFSDLRRGLKSNARNRLIYARAFNQLWIEGIEDGQEEFRKNEFVLAADYFQLMADAAPDQSWPLLLLADTKVREGDHKAALKVLDEAVKRGIKSAQSITGDPELTPLRADPEFQRIVKALGAPKSAS